MEQSSAFARWVDEVGGKAAASRLLGVTPTMVGYLCSGQRLPGLRLAAKIERATCDWSRGPLLAVDWAPEAAA